MNRPCKHKLWKIAFLAIFLPTMFMAYIGFAQAGLNFHALVPGEFYRSGQPTPQELKALSQKYGIKTVINLRGENKHEQWYKDETAAAKRLGIHYVNLRLSSKYEIFPWQAQDIAKVLKSVPKPVLIHCRGGADRTGLVSAIYLGLVKQDADRAKWQLSPYYGHIPLPVHRGYAMDKSLRDLQYLWEPGSSKDVRSH